MEEFYSNLSVNDGDKILEILNEKIEPQKLYIKFRNIIEGIKFPNDLSVYIGKAGGKGRMSFIAQVTKSAWVGNKAKECNGILYCIDGDTFNIHLEGSFDIINKKISLPLHYETNPYVPKAKLLKNTTEV